MRFRPCIDLRAGRVVQIVGGTLQDSDSGSVVTNFETGRAPAEFAAMYRAANLPGGHVIALGPGNRDAALDALRAYPGGIQMGGGITPGNAVEYLEAGASHVIVTSYLFQAGQLDLARLDELVAAVGKERLVIDLSCRARDGEYWVVTDRWQHFTGVKVDRATLESLSLSCDEFLVHGVDVEGMRLGIEGELVQRLGACSPLPVTYAGGARTLDDLENVKQLGQGRVDLTIGSALDIFGGEVAYNDVVAWQRQQESHSLPDDVRRRLARDFPLSDLPTIEAALLALPSYVREFARVVRCVIVHAGGDTGKLIKHLDVARQDYRDAIMMAEYAVVDGKLTRVCNLTDGFTDRKA